MMKDMVNADNIDEALILEQRFPKELYVSRKALVEAEEYGKITLVERPDDHPHSDDIIDIAPLNLWSIENETDKKDILDIKWNGYEFRLSHYVGAVWLDGDEEQLPLIVKPKLSDDGVYVDPVEMFIEVCSLEGVTKKVFNCYPKNKAIEGVELQNVTLFQIAVYLSELSRFVRKHLRKGFKRIHENLTGKVKGKILISDNILLNSSHGRADRVSCQFNVIDIDTIANQILKSALSICAKYLVGFSSSRDSHQKILDKMWEWIRICRDALSGVRNRQIHLSDFLFINYSGLMGRYRYIHELANMILRRIHTDGNGKIEMRQTLTVPFWLDMNALFENYVYVKLLQNGVNCIPQALINLKGGTLPFRCKPDFIIDDGFAVLDAKYKAILDERIGESDADYVKYEGKDQKKWKHTVERTIHSDYYQVIAYSFLITQKQENSVSINRSPASIAGLIVPKLRDIGLSSDNEFKYLKNTCFHKFISWAKNHYPFFELNIDIGTSAEPHNHKLLICVIPCLLPTYSASDEVSVSKF